MEVDGFQNPDPPSQKAFIYLVVLRHFFCFGLLLPGVTLATMHSIHDQRVGINKNAG
jgi:hypothetical protein